MTNILVTGANGQLGSELRRMSGVHGDLRFVFTDIAELDITDVAAVERMIESESSDLVINCAAYTAVDKAEGDPVLAGSLNADAPGLLARAISRRGGEMIHISTDYVFDGLSCVPYTEDMAVAPQSVYGRTKLEGERQVREGCPRHVIVRTAWLYSSFGNNFVKTMLRLGRERESLSVVFDQTGTPTYARDLARAIVHIAATRDKTYGTFHFSNEGVTSWYDFAKAIHRLAGITTCKVSPVRTAQYPTPAQRPCYSVLDKSKIKETYGLEIAHWEDSLGECMSELA